MNLKVVCVLVLITALIVPDVHSWRRRRRRRRSIVHCTPVCIVKVCSWYFVNGMWRRFCLQSCHTVCKTVVGKRDKELAPIQAASDQSDSSKEKVFQVEFPAPSKLSAYDKDKDSRISLAEFKNGLPKGNDKGSTKKVFEFLDKNGDKYIDCEEFLKAKLDFAHKPEC